MAAKCLFFFRHTTVNHTSLWTTSFKKLQILWLGCTFCKFKSIFFPHKCKTFHSIRLVCFCSNTQISSCSFNSSTYVLFSSGKDFPDCNESLCFPLIPLFDRHKDTRHERGAVQKLMAPLTCTWGRMMMSLLAGALQTSEGKKTRVFQVASDQR